MSNKGDDCYFYYYSTCTKGDACPFRHCEAAMGSETVCSLWKENSCFRAVCKFRHMEIKKNRKEIACYWENQPGGCQKSHCAFHHEKPRYIDGLFVAPDKGPVVRKEKEDETPQDEHASPASINISNTTNPQLRGVMKVETQENVPSPTHPPVVINPVDDEDDEDDQFSEEGDEASGGTPKKLLSSNKDELHNFGIKTLEEIRLGKALKASLNTPEFPALEYSRRRKITDRLGKRLDEDMPMEGGLWLKESVAKRLGGFVDVGENKFGMPFQKVTTVRPVYERLGVTPDITAPKSPISELKTSGTFRIKTLEEIRQEKAQKTQMQCKVVRVVTEVPTNESPSTKKVNKCVSVKTFSEILHEKKKPPETKVVPQQSSTATEKTAGLTNTGVTKLTSHATEIRVKTLEEIRKEKAARVQAKTQDAANDVTSSSDSAPKSLLSKTGSAVNVSLQKLNESEKMDCIDESTVTSAKSETSIQDVTVKSFEEIMREKRLRKQKEQNTVDPEQAAQKPPPVLCHKKLPAVVKPGNSHEYVPPVPSIVQQKKCTEMQNSSLTISPKSSSSVALPVQVSEIADSLGQQPQEPHLESIQEVTKIPPNKAAELKVRPKLNVKPSVMKTAAQVKPDHKRKVTGVHCSAVAAVKPLNSASDIEPPCKRIQLSAPSCSLELEARVQQVVSSAEQQSPDSLYVPQSPTIKTLPQTRLRRVSSASARGTASGKTSTLDEFDDLLGEFTDNSLEDEIELDPGKGADDLLLELSEMIDD